MTQIITERTLLRLGLAGAGGILLHLALSIAFSAPLAHILGDVIALIVCGFAGLLILLAAGLRQPSSTLRWFILLACLVDLGVRFTISWQNMPLIDPSVDSALYTDMAGEVLWRGENPYTWDFTGVFDISRTSQIPSTPKLNAANESYYPYPALPILLVMPFQRLHLPGTLMLSLLAHLVLLFLLFLITPRAYQPIILLPAMAGVNFVALSFIGSLDIVWVMLLVAMVALWHYPVLRAFLFGLAIALKQTPWLVGPFLLIHLWHEAKDDEINQIRTFVTIVAGTFLLVNAPFIIWDPEAWLTGVITPMYDNLIYFSQGGLSGLTQFGLVTLPKGYYLFATLTVFTFLLFCYWRHYDALRFSIWIAPGILMWFSYRNLVSYWTYWVFPLLASLVSWSSPPLKRSQKVPWQSTFRVSLVVLGVLLVTGTLLSLTPSAITVMPILPLYASHGRVTRMDVHVINHNSTPLTPRFATQHRYTIGNSLPWTIDRGPHVLPPGESALYRIITTQHDRSFFVYDAAQIIVTDAGGDYNLRGVATLDADTSFLWPDAIPNPDYRFWDEAETAPIFWEIVGSGTANPGEISGRRTAQLTLTATEEISDRVALQTTIPLPRMPFGLWVYVDNATGIYGLEIDDGKHTLWFTFGEAPYTGPRLNNHYVVHHQIPLAQWHYQEVDVMDAYRIAGWDLPVLEPTTYRGMDIDARLIKLRLFLQNTSEKTPLQADFGLFEQSDLRVSPQRLMRETLDDPASYYVRLGDIYERQRNDTYALNAYRRALAFDPENVEARVGMIRLFHRLSREGL